MSQNQELQTVVMNKQTKAIMGKTKQYYEVTTLTPGKA